MEATTPHGEQIRTDIALKCVDVVEWAEGEHPVWVQLALPELRRREQEWFEGSINPWRQTHAPELDWSDVDPVLERAGLAPASLDLHERRLLRGLPFVYGRGVARLAREVWGRQAPAQLRFFPSVAFHPIKKTKPGDPPSFWTVRMTVGVIRNVVVTVRLPDIFWDDDSEDFHYRPGEALAVAERFFPAVDDLSADDVAEAIALQHATTARTVSFEVRTALTKIERKWRMDVASVTRSSRDVALADMRKVIEMTDGVYQLDRQIERLLRRFEPNPAGAADRATPPEVAARYQFALDELRSLEGNGRLASQALRQAITTGEQEDRERFHFVAAVLASVILFPTLVASIYGANVELPAKDTWPGFIGLMLFIVASAIAGPLLIAESVQRKWTPKQIRPPRFLLRYAVAILVALTLTAGVVQVA
jgi:CorA-like Mg2+ transporter protein